MKLLDEQEQRELAGLRGGFDSAADPAAARTRLARAR